ncbi:MAG: small multi-drug export protein [Clostridia bacterium]|nr:small multi-drug export protein [Clostridia bacterium]
MADIIVNFLQSFIKNDYLLVLLTSCFPLIELKGAIPIGTKLGLELLQTAPLAYLGSTLICIPIFFLLVPIFNLLKKIKFVGGFIEKVELVLKNKALKIAKKADGDADSAVKKIYMISLFIFVAVPFPVTGVWTGTAMAVFLGLKFRESILPLAVGNLIAGTIITILTYFFASYVDTIILILFAIAIVMLIVFIIKVATAKKDNADEKAE